MAKRLKEPSTMILDDLVVLGRGAPNNLKDGRISSCVACWSPRVGLIRLYPTSWYSRKIRRWNVIRVEVYQAPGDWRRNSYKIKDSKNFKTIESKIEIVGRIPYPNRHDLIRRISQGYPVNLFYDDYQVVEDNFTCPDELNKLHQSMGLVIPFKIIEHKFEGKKLKIHYKCQRTTPWSYNCESKNGHWATVLEDGVYQWLKKNPTKKERVISNLHLYDDWYMKYFLIGNGVYTPRSFMIISIFRFKRERGSIGIGQSVK